jgi:hypothetical protein
LLLAGRRATSRVSVLALVAVGTWATGGATSSSSPASLTTAGTTLGTPVTAFESAGLGCIAARFAVADRHGLLSGAIGILSSLGLGLLGLLFSRRLRLRCLSLLFGLSSSLLGQTALLLGLIIRFFLLLQSLLAFLFDLLLAGRSVNGARSAEGAGLGVSRR